MNGVGVSANCALVSHAACGGKWGGDETSPCACGCHAHPDTCTCGTCEQNERIRQNMADNLALALEEGDLSAFEDIFEDRDPFEFL